MKKFGVYISLFLCVHVAICMNEEPEEESDLCYTLYSDNEQHHEIIYNTLWGTDEDLQSCLSQLEPSEKKGLINRGIFMISARELDQLNNGVRCTTLAKELILDTSERDSALAKLNTLLSHGYDPNKLFYVGIPNSDYETYSTLPLTNAIARGHIPAVRSLLNSNADPNKQEIFERTPLQILDLCLHNSMLTSQPGSTIVPPMAPHETYIEIARIINEHSHRISGSDESE